MYLKPAIRNHRSASDVRRESLSIWYFAHTRKAAPLYNPAGARVRMASQDASYSLTGTMSPTNNLPPAEVTYVGVHSVPN